MLIPICFLALAVPVVVLAKGVSGGFDQVVNSIETRYHVHADRIPVLGFVSLVAQASTHDGVRGLHVAEIEDFHADVDGEELNKLVAQQLGSGWERVIRETSRNGGDQTLIFMRPEGSRMGMFVIDLGGHEMDVVQMSVDPEHLSERIGKYEHHERD
ncbi:hypothetical protein [Occallatibacter savannae]|uniref:hypothetical protein n=1 Tax=Occallatibacter savannae TaxID=1002691 RepID=UPI0013A55790|nr:hypothetical protein [Occallatibacter savannae]